MTQPQTTDPQQELLFEVDQHNQPIGPITREIAHQSPDKFYRAIFVLVKNQDDQILIQKRSATKDLFPNYWDLSVGGHVNYGATYEQAAARELEEELGIKAAQQDLKFLGEVLVHMPSSNEVFHVFEYQLKADDKIKLSPEEIDQMQWMSISDIKESMAKQTLEWYHRPLQVVAAIYKN